MVFGDENMGRVWFSEKNGDRELSWHVSAAAQQERAVPATVLVGV